MRFNFTTAISLVGVAAISHGAPARDGRVQRRLPAPLPVAISYVKDSCVYVAPPGAKVPECWSPTQGVSNVAISPDATALALTAYSPKSGSMQSSRQIAVIDSKGAKPRVLDSIPGDNSYGPIWSPDSKQLMFSHLNEGKWNVAVVNRDGSGFRVLASPTTAPQILQCAFWASDGKSLYAYDFSNLYQFGLDGKEISRLPFSDFSITLATMGGKVAFNPDGTKLLIEIEDGDSPGAATVVYVFDMKTKRKVSITSRHGEISNPSWLPDGNAIVFTSTGKQHMGIYRKDLATGAEVLVAINASAPSLSGSTRP